MKVYWDSSALVAASLDDTVADIFERSKGVTRVHTLAEIFSTLTGSRLGFRVDAEEAARKISQQAEHLEMVDLTLQSVMNALKNARKRGVRGARVHDFLHAACAVEYVELEIVTPEEL